MRVLAILPLLLLLTACTQAEPTPVERGRSYLEAKTKEADAKEAEPKREYWPDGKLKKEWVNENGMRVLCEYYESGAKHHECFCATYGRILGISYWDEDGVLEQRWDGPMLVVLTCAWCNDAEVAERADLRSIEGIYMRHNTKATDAALESIAKLKNLQWLDITGCKQFSEAALKTFKERLPNCEVRR